MKYRVVERTTYERSFVIEADTPEEAKEICYNESYKSNVKTYFAGTEYTIVGTEEN